MAPFVLPIVLLIFTFVGRRFATTPFRTWTRSLASEVDAIEASLQNSLKETHSIEALIQNETTGYIAPIDDDTHAPVDYDVDSVSYNYHEQKRIRAPSASSSFSMQVLTHFQLQGEPLASSGRPSLHITSLTLS